MRKIKSFFKHALPSLVFSAISLLVGILSALLTKGNMDIYEQINTPKPSPPSALFPIVWTVLFILMGIGAGMVYKNRESNRELARRGLVLYFLQLIVNFLWSILFFNAKTYLLCVLVLLSLLTLVVLMALKFFQVKKIAALIQIPYIVWLIFALYLNIGIVLLN